MFMLGFPPHMKILLRAGIGDRINGAAVLDNKTNILVGLMCQNITFMGAEGVDFLFLSKSYKQFHV